MARYMNMALAVAFVALLVAPAMSARIGPGAARELRQWMTTRTPIGQFNPVGPINAQRFNFQPPPLESICPGLKCYATGSDVAPEFSRFGTQLYTTQGSSNTSGQGTQGIGLAVLKALAGAGANVAMHGLGDKATLANIQAQIKAETGVKVLYSDANLRKPQEIRDAVARVAGELGGLDILHNNAGIQHVGPLETYPEDKWDAIMDVCLNSNFHATKAALPHMFKAGWGRVINTGSMHALVASPYKAAYNAAKHGVAGFTKTLALELAQKNITVNAICPGYVLTDLVKNQIDDTARIRGIPREKVISDVMLADQPTKRFIAPEDIAGMVLHLCGPHSSSITGACLSVDGGWTCR